MKFSVHLRAAIVFLTAVLGAAQDSVDRVGLEHPELPCSCDCCTTHQAAPEDDVVVDYEGNKRQWMCSFPHAEEEWGPTCQTHCFAESTDLASVLFAVKGALDTHRYCQFYCRPTYVEVGSTCSRLDKDDLKKISDVGGNGHTVHWAVGKMDNTGGGGDGGAAFTINQMTSKAIAALKEAKQVADAANVDSKVLYDMRHIIAERLRAEAGAHMARGAAAAQHVVANEYSTKRMAMLTKRVSAALRGLDSRIATKVFDAKSSSQDAKEAAAEARGMYREVSNTFQNIIDSTEKLAVAEIKKQTTAAALREARAQVILRGWDHPANYGKSLAVMAAEPYMKEMVTAITRESEYEAFAKGLLGQAKGAKSQAQALATHANAMLAHGDKIGSVRERDQVRGLIAKSKNLEAEANKFWNVADAARNVIPEWQIAGANVAARTSWEWALSLTPEPSAKDE